MAMQVDPNVSIDHLTTIEKSEVHVVLIVLVTSNNFLTRQFFV